MKLQPAGGLLEFLQRVPDSRGRLGRRRSSAAPASGSVVGLPISRSRISSAAFALPPFDSSISARTMARKSSSVTASNRKRDGLQRALTMLGKGKADGIVIANDLFHRKCDIP